MSRKSFQLFVVVLTGILPFIITARSHGQTVQTKNESTTSTVSQELEIREAELFNLVLTEHGLKTIVFPGCYTVECVLVRADESGINNIDIQKALMNPSNFHNPPADYFLEGQVEMVQPSTATINVTYNGFSAQAQTAFQHAVNIWAATIQSPVTINIVANWTPLSPGVLGSAGPNYIIRNFPGSVPNTFYANALADAISGTNQFAGQHEINASFNSDFDSWYFGTDGNTPLDQWDFVSVVLHELCHGLGFFGSMWESGGGQIGWGYDIPPDPVIYDRFTEDLTGNSLIDTGTYGNPSSALYTQLTTDFENFVDAPLTVLTNSNSRPLLYTPSTWSGGSSYSHWRDGTYDGTENSLMTHALFNGESQFDIGPITLAFFMDMGWPMDQTNVIPDVTFEAATTDVTENVGPGQLTLSRANGDLRVASIVQVNITGGTANGGDTLPADYDNTSFPLSISFGPGETSKIVNLPLFDDSTIEGLETVTFSVTSSANADITGQTTMILHINDNDAVAPEIDVQRPAGTSIADGGTDNTGNQEVGAVNLTYTIDNSAGTAQLTIPSGGVTATNYVTSNGFDVETILPLNVAAGGSATLNVSFNVSTPGPFSLDMAITNNDGDENPYDINIAGTANVPPEPEIKVMGNSLSILNNDSTPSTLDGTDFSNSKINEGTIVHTFIISNTGSSNLTLTGTPIVALTTGTHFSITKQPKTTSLVPEESTTFVITFDPLVTGTFSDKVTIENNDPGGNPYIFAIQGTGIRQIFIPFVRR
ncbi:choice-of-anchor D domain-containing protein [Chloroflexota bacterium]